MSLYPAPYGVTYGGAGFGPVLGTVDRGQVAGGDGPPAVGQAVGLDGLAPIEQVRREAGPGAWRGIAVGVDAGQGRATFDWTPAGGLRHQDLGWGLYSTYRRILSHPTVALGTLFITNEVLQATIDVRGVDKGVDPDWVDLIRRMFLPTRRAVMAECVRSMWYGWKPLEKVWSRRGRNLWCQLKPHYSDFSRIYLSRRTGLYAGMSFLGFGLDVLPPNRTLPIVFGMEAGNLYGSPLLDNAYDAIEEWGRNQLDLFKVRAKLSGILPILKYPPGTTPQPGPNGTTVQVDNSVIAQAILDSLGMGNGVCMPSVGYDAKAIQATPALAGVSLWTLEFQNNGTLSPAIDGMLAVKSSLKVDLINALGLPERALMEGEHGTKAEAGVHSENTVPMIEAAIASFLDQLNHGIPTMGVTGAVDDVLLYNFGQRAVGQVELVYTPIDNSKLGLVKDVLLGWMSCQDDNKSVAIAKGVDINRAFTDTGFYLRDQAEDTEDEGPGIDVAEYEQATLLKGQPPESPDGPEGEPVGGVPLEQDGTPGVLDQVRAAGERRAERLG